jgi:acetyl-CoA carboxylase biotin carboxyl carrier protein
MNIKEVQDLIKFVAKSGVSEVQIEQKDFKVTIKSENKKEDKQIYVQAPAVLPVQDTKPIAVQSAPAEISTETTVSEDSKYLTVKSPMIGTFYRSAGPDKDVFVSVGDTVGIGDTVCIIEAMKLFNEIEAEIKGKIVKILVDDATPVEYDQPLFLVDPS